MPTILDVDPHDDRVLRAFWENEQAAMRADRRHPVLRTYTALEAMVRDPSPYNGRALLVAVDDGRVLGGADVRWPLALAQRVRHRGRSALLRLRGQCRLRPARRAVPPPRGARRPPGSGAHRPAVGLVAESALEVWSDLAPPAELRAALPAAVQLGKLSRVESWTRCLVSCSPQERDEWGQGPAGTLAMLLEDPPVVLT